METKDPYMPHSIKLQELETSFVNTPAVTAFCISWSKDDKISVLVEGGVFIFELLPTPLSDQPTVTFAKSWIPSNTAAPLLNAVVENENGSFLWSLDRKQVYEVTLDSTLSHAVQKPNYAIGNSQVIQCEFSPLIHCKSYISCLTNNGLLEIYKNSLKKWTPVVNVTELWIKHCDFKENCKKINFETFKSKMFKLKITTMKWIEKPEVLFMTGHENGEIVLWKVDVSTDNFLMSVKHIVKVDGKPVYLNLCGAPNSENLFLFVGLSSGVVKCLTISSNTGVENCNFNLWEYDDRLAPNIIKIMHLFNKLFVFTIKQHILLIQSLGLDEVNQLKILKTHWEEFPMTITGWDEYQNSFVICLQNQDIYMLDIKNINEDIVVVKNLVDLGVKKKHKSTHFWYGLAMSINKVIWIIVSSPKVNYDSLKEVTHLILFSPEVKIYKSLSNTSSSELMESILKNYKSTQLNEIFDLLELKKLELIANAAKFKENYEIEEDLPLMYLQLMLWEVKLKLFCNFSDENSLITELEFLITLNRTKRVIYELKKCSSLTPLQEKCLHLCEMFVMNKKEKSKPLDEVCCICGSDSFLYNTRISSCPNLHKFPRCCLSLLPCNVVPYAVCTICESVALVDFVVEGDNRCPYCDGLLELDTRFRRGA